MAIHSLLVPLDYGSEGDQALPVAGRLAVAAGIPVELITVSSPGLSEEADEIELTRRSADLAPARADWTIVHDDDPGPALVRALHARPEALMVVGTGARGPLAELVRGSVSDSMLAAAGRPMLFVGPEVAPADEEAIAGRDHLVVAVDSWEGAERLLDAVVDAVDAFRATVEVVEVLAPTQNPVPGDRGESNLARAVALALRERGVIAEWEVLHGDRPATTLVGLAHDRGATLIAAATARWATGHRVHWHSTVREIVRDAEVPVLLVAPEPADGGDG